MDQADEDIIDRANVEFEREAAERVSLDMEKSRSSRKTTAPEPEDDVADVFGPDEFDPPEGFYTTNAEEQVFWLSTHRENTAFMQVCHQSDRMSAVFATNLESDVSVPLLIEEDFALRS